MDHRGIHTKGGEGKNNTRFLIRKTHLKEAAKRFLAEAAQYRVFAFHGEMGAGKTTFIKALCQELGVKDAINSPTFSIMNEYRSEISGEPVRHFDFYRIKSPAEAIDLGLTEYFCTGDFCFIEWPEIIADYLPEDALHVFICENADGARTLSLRR